MASILGPSPEPPPLLLGEVGSPERTATHWPSRYHLQFYPSFKATWEAEIDVRSPKLDTVLNPDPMALRMALSDESPEP